MDSNFNVNNILASLIAFFVMSFFFHQHVVIAAVSDESLSEEASPAEYLDGRSFSRDNPTGMGYL